MSHALAHTNILDNPAVTVDSLWIHPGQHTRFDTVCVCVCVRACVRACVCECLRACVRACVCCRRPQCPEDAAPLPGECCLLRHQRARDALLIRVETGARAVTAQGFNQAWKRAGHVVQPSPPQPIPPSLPSSLLSLDSLLSLVPAPPSQRASRPRCVSPSQSSGRGFSNSESEPVRAPTSVRCQSSERRARV